MSIGTVTNATSSGTHGLCAAATSPATYVHTVTLLQCAPPSPSLLANTNDTNVTVSLGATDSNARYPTDSIGHKNYFQAPLAPLQLGRWSRKYQDPHTSLRTKRDSDQASVASDLNFSTPKKGVLSE